MVRLLLRCYASYKQVLCFVIIGSLTGSALELCFPLVIRHIMEDLLPGGSAVLLAQAAGGLFLLYIAAYFLNRSVFCRGRGMGAEIEYDLRCKLFRHIMQMSFAYFDNARTGQLLSRLVNDIAEIGQLMFYIPNLVIVCTVTMLGTISLLFYLNWQLASVVSVLLVLKAYEAVSVNQRMKASFMEAREKTGNLNTRVAESLNAIRLVKIFHNETLEAEKLLTAGRELLTAQQKSFGIVGTMNGSLVLFSNTTNLVIIVLGGLLTANGQMRLSDLVTFLLYMMIFMKPVFQLTMLTEAYQRGMAGFRRYAEIMALPADDGRQDKNAAGLKTLSAVTGHIQFEHVDFAYDAAKPVLQNFSLDIRPGERIAVVGATGSGKTTLCQLLPRLYEISNGHICIDGTDIRQLTLSSLRRHIGMVQQDVFLFSDSIRENIAYGSPGASKQEILAAARLAEVHDFAVSLPDGYDTFVGERGVKLSGGQRQRIAIARIFLKNPPILILDEATSALDNETEQQVRQALDRLSEHRTTLLVAHRLASVQDADRILLLEKGRIAEAGSHEALLRRRGLYYDLYMAQFRENRPDRHKTGSEREADACLGRKSRRLTTDGGEASG